MEGRIEALEDAVHLFESAVRVLNRQHLSDDDVLTLRELIIQLPRLDDALEKVAPHEAAARLVELFKLHLSFVSDAVMAFLQKSPSSLRTGLQEIVGRLERRARPPVPGEAVLIESGGEVGFGPLATAAAAAAGTAVFGGPFAPAAALVFPFTWWLGKLTMRSAAWVLLADRLFLRDRSGDRQHEVSTLKDLELDGDSCVVNGEWITKEHGPALFQWLTLLRAPLLANLSSRPRIGLRLTATREEPTVKGHVLVLGEGVLFLPNDLHQALANALMSAPLERTPPGAEVLRLLAHLPEGRLAAVGSQLSSRGGLWWPRAEFRVNGGKLEVVRFVANDGTTLRLELPVSSEGAALHEQLFTLLG